MRRLLLSGTVVALLVASPAVAGAGVPASVVSPPPGVVDCDGPPAAASPGTPAWAQRELAEATCGEQRLGDTATNPAFDAGSTSGLRQQDPYRDPVALDGHRFRYRPITLPDPNGVQLPGALFLPCDHTCTAIPTGLSKHEGPYPAVVVVHGGSAQQQMYLWGAEALAEAGYMVVTFQVPTAQNTGPAAFPGDTTAALNWLFSTPSRPDGAGNVNPAWRLLDRDHVGVAGHSAGGYAASLVGQQDRRVRAIVSWDRAQSSPMPPDLRLRTPALFFAADYNCQKVPVCLPQPYSSAPDPHGPGDKDTDFTRLRAEHVDTMKITLRDATHLDFTQFVPGTGSRYGTAVTAYYTLAWFDRYLRGAQPGQSAVRADALRRLTAARFDSSGDVHNISGGQFEPATQQNLPALLSGQPVTNRISFRFRSGYWLDGGAIARDDLRGTAGG